MAEQERLSLLEGFAHGGVCGSRLVAFVPVFPTDSCEPVHTCAGHASLARSQGPPSPLPLIPYGSRQGWGAICPCPSV